jgi:hypothetical protein
VARWAESSSLDVGLRARITSERREDDVLVEVVETADAGAPPEKGLPKGIRRTGRSRPVRMPVLDRFEPTLTRKLPAGYVLREDAVAALAPLLELHGIRIDRLSSDHENPATVQPFVVESWDAGPRFQNHRETTVRGRYEGEAKRELPDGTAVVWTSQPRGILAMYLLEPESDDGVVTWNFLDHLLAKEKEFPVLRIVQLRKRTTKG